MEKTIEVCSCLYDAADSIVEESERGIRDTVQYAIEGYTDWKLEDLEGEEASVEVGEVVGYSQVEVAYCVHGRCVDTEMEPASLIVEMFIEFDVHELLAKGVFEGEAVVDRAVLETKHDDVELDDDELGDLGEELTRSLKENIDWSEFKRI